MSRPVSPRLRRAAHRRRPAVERALDGMIATVDARMDALAPAQRRRFLDLMRRAGPPEPGLDPLDGDERAELGRLWAWYLDGIGAETFAAWTRRELAQEGEARP